MRSRKVSPKEAVGTMLQNDDKPVILGKRNQRRQTRQIAGRHVKKISVPKGSQHGSLIRDDHETTIADRTRALYRPYPPQSGGEVKRHREALCRGARAQFLLRLRERVAGRTRSASPR